MNKKPYLVNGKLMTYGELVLKAIDCDYDGDDLYSPAVIEFLQNTKPQHTVVIRQWDKAADCYEDELEKVNV